MQKGEVLIIAILSLWEFLNPIVVFQKTKHVHMFTFKHITSGLSDFFPFFFFVLPFNIEAVFHSKIKTYLIENCLDCHRVDKFNIFPQWIFS